MLASLSLTKTSVWNLISLSGLSSYLQPAAGSSAPNSQDAAHENTSAEHLVHDWLDSSFRRLQLIVLWREPLKSLLLIPAMLLAFVVVTQLPVRPYSLLFGALFIHQFTIVWFRYVWPEIRVASSSKEPQKGPEELHVHGLMSLQDLQMHLLNLINSSENTIAQLLHFRHQKPINFCLAVCSLLSCTLFIGSSLSGFTLTFTLLASILLLPGIYSHLLTQSAKQMVKHFVLSTKPNLQPDHSTQADHNLSLFDQLKQMSFLSCCNTSFVSDSTAETQQLVTDGNPVRDNSEANKQEMIEDPSNPTSPTTNPLLSSTDGLTHHSEDEIQEGFVIL